MIDVAEIVGDCLERLADRYSVVSLVLGGSAANNFERALDADICAVVREDAMERAHIRLASSSVDLFICGLERLHLDFNRGGIHQYLVRLLATGKHLFGETSTTEELQSLTRRLLRGPAPGPSKRSSVSHRSRPFNLLRKFRTVCKDDPATAGLIVAELVHSSVEAFFSLNRIWTTGVRERMAVIAAHNPEGADALQRVIEAPLETLCRQPRLLEHMVRHLVGEDLGSGDVWLT